jgi:hypothetical protein
MSTSDQMFCIHQILEKEWEYNETVHQLYILRRPMTRREVLYNILTQFGIPIKLVGLIQICLNETYSKTHR